MRFRHLSLALVVAPLVVPLGAPSAAQASCAGIPLSPSQDVATIVNAGAPGATYCLAPGLYRLSKPISPKAGMTLVGAGEGATVLSAGRRATGWTPSGGAWVAGGQTQGPTDNGGLAGGALRYPQQRYDDDVFMDGAMLWRVGVQVNGQVVGQAPSAVGPGQFFFNYDTDTITLGSDPTGHVVDVASLPYVVEGSAANVTVADLTVQEASSKGIQGRGSHWTVDHVESTLNADTGITVLDYGHVTGSFIHDNGIYGVDGHGAGLVVDGNEVSRNDEARVMKTNGGCSAAGGAKWVNTTNLVVSNNSFHDNYCNGIWLDIDNYDSTVTDNQSVRNLGSGIIHEISYNGVFSGNTVLDNSRYGIVVNDSSGDLISGNLVGGNASGQIMLHNSDRSGDYPSGYGPHQVANVRVDRNDFVLRSASEKNGSVNGGADFMFTAAAGNRFTNNTWQLVSPADRAFRWCGHRLDQGGWRAAGEDPDGIFGLAPAS